MTIHHLPAPGTRLAPDGYLTSAELIHDAGITYRQADYWTRTDLLTAVVEGPSSGYSRYYATSQLTRATTIRWLLDAGISLPTIRDVLDELLEVGHVRLTDGLVIHLPQHH